MKIIYEFYSVLRVLDELPEGTTPNDLLFIDGEVIVSRFAPVRGEGGQDDVDWVEIQVTGMTYDQPVGESDFVFEHAGFWHRYALWGWSNVRDNFTIPQDLRIDDSGPNAGGVGALLNRSTRVAIDLLCDYAEVANFALDFVDELRDSVDLFNALADHMTGQVNMIDKLLNNGVNIEEFLLETDRLTLELERSLIVDQLGSDLGGVVTDMLVDYTLETTILSDGSISTEFSEADVSWGEANVGSSSDLHYIIGGTGDTTLRVDGIGVFGALGGGADTVYQSKTALFSSLDGGDGYDTWQIEPDVSGARVNVDLRSGSVVGKSAEGSTSLIGLISNFERIVLSFGDDRAQGNGLANEFQLGGGNDWVNAGRGNDRVRAGDGDDQIIMGPGKNYATGGRGSDVFHFSTPRARDTIADFTPGDDKYDVSLWRDTTSWRDLRLNHLSQDGDDVVLKDDEGNIITRFLDRIFDQFRSDDFVF
jgi:hypothetical protein